MPFVDAALDALLDPMVAATPFSVVRRRSWTNTNGFQQQSSLTQRGIGSVTPTGDNSLSREDGFQSQPKTILVITRTFLRSAAEDADGFEWQPDLVLWQNNHYLVKSLEDFGQFGGGFVAATCEIFEFTASPAIGNPPAWALADFRDRRYSGFLGAIAQ